MFSLVVSGSLVSGEDDSEKLLEKAKEHEIIPEDAEKLFPEEEFIIREKGVENLEPLREQRIPSFGEDTLQEVKEKDSVITSEGRIPSMQDDEERRNWYGKINQVREEVNDVMKPYHYPDGPVISHGMYKGGYFAYSGAPDHLVRSHPTT